MTAFPSIANLLDFVPREVLARRAKPARPLPSLPPSLPPEPAPGEEPAPPAAAGSRPPPPAPPSAPANPPPKKRFFADIFGPFGKS